MTTTATPVSDIDYLREMVRERSAIVLEPEKLYLIEARLQPLQQREGVESLEALAKMVRENKDERLQADIVEAMTTNETSFFRDRHPFTALQKLVLPDLKERRSATKVLNIWCAASSSGQEPYSILMVLRQHLPELNDWHVRLIGTDISPKMVERTREGRFSQLEINRGLPAPMLIRFFEKDGVTWRAKPELRRMLEVKVFNLAAAWPALPAMDIIFIRNVLIYFDNETKKKILARMAKLLKPDGYLFLGGAETPINLSDRFQRVKESNSGCYQLEPAEKAK